MGTKVGLHISPCNQTPGGQQMMTIASLADLNPTSYWNAEDLALSPGTDVTTWPDSVGSNDLSQATASNKPTYKDDAAHNQSYVEFEIDDFMQLASTSEFDFDLSAQFTIVVVGGAFNQSAIRTIIGKFNTSGLVDRGWLMQMDQQTNRTSLRFIDNLLGNEKHSHGSRLDTGGAAPTSCHIITYNGSGNASDIKHYHASNTGSRSDGEIVAADDIFLFSTPSTVPFTMGARNGVDQFCRDFHMYQCAMWDGTVLTPTEIESVFNYYNSLFVP